ncbi:MAG: apolipoprotein N-acyltransferase [Rikenellaceae bacterium]
MKIDKLTRKNVLRVALFVVLGALPWWGITPLSQFLMFVPLLLIQRDLKGVGVMKWWILALVLWNLSAVWWVAKATILGPIAATLATTTFLSVALVSYNYVWKRATLSLAYTTLITGFLAAEWFYGYNLEVSFPWLNLGNGFGITPQLVQWYEFTGSLGGTLWVLVVNVLLFEAIKNDVSIDFKRLMLKPKVVAAFLIVILPIVASLARYATYQNDGEQVRVAALQPNIDPYTEKFEKDNIDSQEQILLDLATAIEPNSVDFIIAPETALGRNVIINNIANNSSVASIRQLLSQRQPNADFITGVVAMEYFYKSKYKEAPTFTARTKDNLPFFYESYNAAMCVNLDSVSFYHKSRLAIGVEMTPFYRYTRHLGQWFIDLGGAFGMFGTQEDRTPFINSNSGISAGTAICYEFVYGEFITQFVKNGADVLFVISNDGWWGDTPGYKQLLSFASLRAIETRRDVARSANTGISAIINSRGEITKRTKWDERVVLEAAIESNSDITFYVMYGDYIGRIASFMFVLSMLYMVAYCYKRKNHLS